MLRLFPRRGRGRVPTDRYPTRIFLSAYMLHAHPELILSGTSASEPRLQHCAFELLSAFESLLLCLLSPTAPNSRPESPDFTAVGVPTEERNPGVGGPTEGCASAAAGLSKRALVRAFDAHWRAFLEVFVDWKADDAAAISRDLVRMACDMQESLLASIGADVASPAVCDSPQLQVRASACVGSRP